LIPPPAAEDEQMSGEWVKVQMLPHHGVQPIKALAHIACGQAHIHPDAGRQVNHARRVSNTVRSVAASTPAPIRNRSPLVSTSSRLISADGPGNTPLSTNAKRTGACFRSRLRQA
jgi:hypothetical protein